MSPPLLPGALVGRYKLEHVLGRGGMGEVWAAMHTATSRRAALKFLRGPTQLRPEARRRFLREARAATAVNHPNVVQIHDFFELEDGTPVMVMDLLHGETLGERLKREVKLSLVDAVNVILPVVSAVGTAHSLGIVHRDLKPDNVFLARRPTGDALDVRVLDFGIAKLTAAAAANETGGATDTGTMLGTPCYMSPEQSFGEKDVDCRADVWAIGVMLYEALSGGVPLVADNLGQFVKRLVTEGITPLEALVPNLPAPIYVLVTRMLSRDRERRPSDLREVWEILSPFGTVQAPNFAPAVSERPPAEVESDATAGARRIGATPPVSDIDATQSASTAAASPAALNPGTDGAQSVSVRRSTARSRPGVIVIALAVGVALVVIVVSLERQGPSVATSATPMAAGIPAQVAATAAPRPTASEAPHANGEAASATPVAAPAPSASAMPAPKTVTRAHSKRERVVEAVTSAAPAPPPAPHPSQTSSRGLIDDVPF
jgi:serine/threonine protein kinase